jgi:hypothetical protein
MSSVLGACRPGQSDSATLPPKPTSPAAKLSAAPFQRLSLLGLLRNWWLFDGKRGSGSGAAEWHLPAHSKASARPCPRAVEPGQPGALPPFVVKALQSQKLHVLHAWLEIDGRRAVRQTDPNGCTALHYAVLGPFEAAVALLLEHSAPVDARLPNGTTPLLLATMRLASDRSAHQRVVEALLAAGATPDVPDRDGHTALMVASRAGHIETVRVLCGHGASTEARDYREQRTAMQYACMFEQRGVVMLLRQQQQREVTKMRREAPHEGLRGCQRQAQAL